MKSFKTIALHSTLNKEEIVDIVEHCCEVLLSKNIKILLSNNLHSLKSKLKVSKSSNAKIIKEADLVISIGGDGTMLDSARKFGYSNIPLLGVNLGRLGFLTDIRPENLSFCLGEIIKGSYLSEERCILEARFNNNPPKLLALNEFVIHSGAVAQLIEFELFVDGIFVYRQKADGLIVSSPTGSTAYSLSGGGPILHPNLGAFILLPMFPQSLSSSPLVLSDDSLIKINIVGDRNNALFSLDSHDKKSLKKGDEISISKAKNTITLVHPVEHDFYSACRTKLGWSSEIASKLNDN